MGVLTLAVTAGPAVASAPRADRAHHYDRSLFAVDGVASDDVWAVGLTADDDTAVRHWDGSGWRTVRHPRSPVPAVFTGVDARVANDVWAVGRHSPDDGLSAAYVQHWTGSRWRVVPADPGLAVSEAAAVDARTAHDAWLVGDAQQDAAGYLIPLLEHWDGRQWTSVAGARTGRTCDAQLADVAVVAVDDVWAVGTRTCSAGSSTLVEHWDGRRWALVDAPSPHSAGLQGITAVAANDLWAVGSSSAGSGPGRNLVLHWDGARWTRRAAPNPGGSSCDHSPSAVSASGAADVWVASTRSCRSGVTPEMLHWDGTAWTKVRCPSTGFDDPPGDGLYDVVALAKRSAFTVGVAKTSGASVEVGFIEHWNGRSWTVQ